MSEEQDQGRGGLSVLLPGIGTRLGILAAVIALASAVMAARAPRGVFWPVFWILLGGPFALIAQMVEPLTLRLAFLALAAALLSTCFIPYLLRPTAFTRILAGVGCVTWVLISGVIVPG